MSRKSLNISKTRSQNSESRIQNKRQKTTNLLFWLLASIFCILLLSSCAPKIVERPAPARITLNDLLARLNTIQSVEAVLAIDYEKGDSVMSGDGFLNVSDDSLNLRIYYLGFLAGEVNEEHGVVKSKPKLDKNKSAILIDGLKNSFLWWNIKDYTVQERDDTYVLKNYSRTIVLSKETLLPVQQTIELDNGNQLNIHYEEPVKNIPKSEIKAPQPQQDTLVPWYQSRLTIQLKKHLVKVKVKSYTIAKAKDPEVRSQ